MRVATGGDTARQFRLDVTTSGDTWETGSTTRLVAGQRLARRGSVSAVRERTGRGGRRESGSIPTTSRYGGRAMRTVGECAERRMRRPPTGVTAEASLQRRSRIHRVRGFCSDSPARQVSPTISGDRSVSWATTWAFCATTGASNWVRGARRARRALEHVYGATAQPVLDPEEWRALPSGLRLELGGEPINELPATCKTAGRGSGSRSRSRVAVSGRRCRRCRSAVVLWRSRLGALLGLVRRRVSGGRVQVAASRGRGDRRRRRRSGSGRPWWWA